MKTLRERGQVTCTTRKPEEKQSQMDEYHLNDTLSSPCQL